MDCTDPGLGLRFGLWQPSVLPVASTKSIRRSVGEGGWHFQHPVANTDNSIADTQASSGSTSKDLKRALLVRHL